MLDTTRKTDASPASPLSRRDFVRLASLAAVPLPGFLLRAAESLGEAAPSSAGEGPILVMVQLSGGNDGLNTVIPCEDSRYHDARPTLAIHPSQVLRLEKGGPLGLHPQMKELHRLFLDGKAMVIEGVGYPNPNRSHFRSMEIWHTARPDQENVDEGWLGRAIARSRIEALDVGDNRVPLALTAPGVHVPALQNLNWLDVLFSSRGRELREMMRSLMERRRRGDREFLRGATQSTFTQLEKLESLRGQPLPVEYPGGAFGRRLQWTGQLIAGGLPSRIYYVSLGGFDTHAEQRELHARLLRQLSDGVAAFYRHLERVGMANRVALVAFSEFGRRVKENGSLGTDHGVAGPMLVVSGRCRGGLVGEAPDLVHLDGGDVRHEIDFRRVYATVLRDILGVPPAEILGGSFDPLPLFRRATAL